MKPFKTFYEKSNNTTLLSIPFMDTLICIILVLGNLVFISYHFKDHSNYAISFYLLLFTFLTALLLMLPRIINKIGVLLVLLVIYIYMIAQKLYHVAFSQYFNIKTIIAQLTEALEVRTSIMEYISPHVLYPLFIWFITLLIFILLKYNKKSKYIIRAMVGVVFLLLTYFQSSSILKDIQSSTLPKTDVAFFQSDFYIFYNYPSSNSFVNRYGKLAILYRDIIISTISSTQDVLQNVSFSETQITLEEITDVVIERRKANTVYENEYTGILAGKDFLLIEAESLMNFAIDETLTPTLYMLYQEGVFFSRYNSTLFPGSTSDTEFIINVSSFPNRYGISYFENHNNYYPTSLPSLFKSAGYRTTALHANGGEFYNRSAMLNSLGYSFYDAKNLDLKNYELDSIAATKLISYFSSSRSDFVFWITYNGHQPYQPISSDCLCGNEIGIPIPDAYFQRAKEKYPEDTDMINCYRAKVMDLDYGIQLFMEAYGNNDDLVIIIYGDHIAKGLDINNDEIDSIFEYNTPLIIWNPSLEAQIIDKPSTAMDVLPTIANLFGMTYDSATVYGHDLFSPEYTGFYFNEANNIVTKDYIYYEQYDSIILLTDTFTVEEVRNQIATFFFEKEVSRMIVEFDYYGELRDEYERGKEKD